MSNLSAAEKNLIQRHLHKIVPIQDGFHRCFTFLTEHFTISDTPIDVQLSASLEANLHCTFPTQTEPFQLHGYSVHKKDTCQNASFISSEYPVLVVLATDIGCVFCNDHRLDMELSIRNTISQEDISTQSNLLRYRIFCYAELEQYC